MLQAGKMAEIANELLQYDLDITALQEIRWKGYGRIKKQKYILLYSGAEKQGEQGVGFVIKRSLENSIIGFEPINSRLCKVRIKGIFFNITMVNAYAPTENATEEQKEQFYEDLNRCCDQIPKHDALLILGDFNAKIGKELANQSVAGQHTIHEKTSENGLILCQFAETNELIISSTCFEHKDIHKGTWIDPAGRIVNQIDHVLVNKRRATIIEDVKTMRGANCDSDHFLIRTIIRQKIACTYQKKQEYKLRWNTYKLENKEKENQYQECIIEKLKKIERKQEVNEEWINIRNVILEAAKEEIGEQRKERNRDWYDEECQCSMKEKNDARKKCLNKETRKNREEYKEKRKIATKLCRWKKREMWNKKIEEIKGANMEKNVRKFYKEVKEMGKEYQQQNIVYKDEKGKILTEKKDILLRWQQYFQLLFEDELQTLGENGEANENKEEVEDIDKPTYEEMIEVISKIKRGKAPGIDNITVELVKKGGPELLQRIFELLMQIWEQERMPEEWGIGIICPIFKKGDRKECSNYRGITLLNSTYKIFTCLIYNRLAKYSELTLGEYQAGFRPSRSTIDQIHVVRQILEKCYEFGIELHNIFIDFKQAFDKVNRLKLYESLKMLKIPTKLIRLVRMTLTNSRAAVEIYQGRTEVFNIHNGLRQGDALSTILFNLVLEAALLKIDLRGNISTRTKQLCAYADDVVIIARTQNALKETFITLQKEAEKQGLIINTSKTKYMKLTRKTNVTKQDMEVNGTSYEAVNQFIYLGSQINSKNLIQEEIRLRIQAGNRSVFANKKLLKNKDLNAASKLQIYKSIIRPIVTYSCKTWSMTVTEQNHLLVFERRVLRKIYGPKQDKDGVWRIKTNEELEKLIKGKNIVRFIKAQRLRWVAHVIRMEATRTVKKLTEWEPGAVRPVGRPRLRWLDQVEEDLMRMKVRNWREKCKDRRLWNEIVKQAKTHRGL
jgi:hypothetical protein